ncbi:hypothetical protein BJ742DRAFT_798934 [Cladochytrium replicatum]|nr:hypothetical protein BJ742DRAFT_798934 [Cladochytrium replicatum]
MASYYNFDVDTPRQSAYGGVRSSNANIPAVLQAQPNGMYGTYGAALVPEPESPHDSKSSGSDKPRLLIMGMRRSGKSSIQRVVFHKMAPTETLFIESTTNVEKENVVSYIDFQIWDFPGQIDFSENSFDHDSLFARCGALVFVIDAQDEYNEALQRLVNTVSVAHKINPKIYFEVFIHKVDGLTEDLKIEAQQDVNQRIQEELGNLAGNENIHISCYLTSIYDHSIFEAFSKVVQKLISELPTLENLLDILCSTTGIEKAFLFDTECKIYVATDTSPVDMKSYELCSDMIDVVLDMAALYAEPVPPTLQPPISEKTTLDSEDSYSVIRLNNNMVLYMRSVSSRLALICLLREENFEQQGLIDYNFRVFKDSILEVFEVSRRETNGEGDFGENGTDAAGTIR